MAHIDNDLELAERRMAAHREAGYAVSAHFDPNLAEGLADASPNSLADIEISPTGLGLHWPQLDADIYIPGLLQGLFGSKSWMARALGAKGGQSRSDAKTSASRNNGQKGGRPRKSTAA